MGARGSGVLGYGVGPGGIGDPGHVVAGQGKMRVADQIASRALRADAVESITCGYLSGVVLLGLIAQLFMPGWWWVDSVTSLAIVVLLVKEGREAWEGEESETE
jgi:divalent metal cation (Fe/Co/Zn/Cd) transporter